MPARDAPEGAIESGIGTRHRGTDGFRAQSPPGREADQARPGTQKRESFAGGCQDHDRDTQGGTAAEQEPRSILILSDIRFLREGLAEVLKRDSAFAIVGLAADVEEALTTAADVAPQIILVDVAL